jgi:K+-transporting ATPase ATPase C chain
MHSMRSLLRPAAILFGLVTILTGLVYPIAVTGLAQALFPYQADGSLILDHGRVIGSELIGQPFHDPRYFWGRPSATAPYACNAAASTGSNLGPTNPALTEAVVARIAALKTTDPANTMTVPVDLVTASGSGLDPHISPAAAYYQVGRIARVRGLPAEDVRHLVNEMVESRTLGVLGEPHLNVLLLNLRLNVLDKSRR